MTEQDGTEPDIHSIQGHKEKVLMERADNFRACHERNHLCCSSTNEDHVNMIENFKMVIFFGNGLLHIQVESHFLKENFYSRGQ